MPGLALLLATNAREFGAPDFFLTFLLADEGFERGDVDEPQARDLAAVDQVLTCEAGDVISSELHDARGIARA